MSDVLISRRSSTFKYNLFVQPTEPITKDGLWIMAPERGFIDIVCKSNFLMSGTLADDSVCEFSTGFKPEYYWMDNKCYEGRYIYGVAWGSPTKIIKFDVFSGTYSYPYTTDMNGHYVASNCVLFLNDIIYIGWTSSYSNGRTSFSPYYNMKDDAPTTDNVSFDGHYGLSEGQGQAIGIEIDDDNAMIVGFGSYQIIGVYTWSTNTTTYYTSQFDISTIRGDTISGKVSTNTNTGSYYNGYVYLFSKNILYKINIVTKEIVHMVCPWSADVEQLKVVRVSGKIYLFTSPEIFCQSTSGNQYNSTMYIFDIETETFLQRLEFPTEYVVNYANYVPDHGIFMFSLGLLQGGGSKSKVNKQYSFTNEPQPDGTICIQNGTEYPIRLFDAKKIINSLPHTTSPLFEQPEYNYKPDFSFSNAWLIKDGEFQKYPSYTGDGTKWNLFKNPQ